MDEQRVEDLERELQLLKEDLRTSRQHQVRIQRAAEHLANGIKLLAKADDELNT